MQATCGWGFEVRKDDTIQCENNMRVAVIDIGKPGKNLGWAMTNPTLREWTLMSVWQR
jgi:hypothetical protein